MKKTTRFGKGLRLIAAFSLLGAILACGGSDGDDSPPAVTAPVPPPVPTPVPEPVVQEVTTAVALTPGFMPDPHNANGTAGGAVQANTFDPSCRGQIPSIPNHTLTLADDFQNLKIMVNSTGDTTLTIRDPAGVYRCNDDGTGEGLNPAIEGAFAAGTYQVYVGVFSAGRPAYTIGFTEIPTNMSANLPLP